MGAPFLFLILVIYLIVKANSKGTKGRAKAGRVRKPSVQTEPAVQTASRENIQPLQAETPSRPEMSVMDAPSERPQVSVHVSEHHHEDMFAGSMNADGTEGNAEAFDLMPSEHSAELFSESEPETAPASGGLHLDWTASGLVNAVIMSEVLQRPKFRCP